jgi:uncharacterized GH25 family protein
LRLWADHEGYVPLFVQWWPEQQPNGPEAPQEFTFKLTKGETIGGIVANDDAEPIQGATVEVMCDVGDGRAAELSGKPIVSIWLSSGSDAVKTDARGRWTLNNVPAGAKVRLTLKVSHPEYISDDIWGGIQKKQLISEQMLRDQIAIVTLTKGTRVTGKVTDDSGNAIAGAVVIWGDDPYDQEGSQEVRTDKAGNYKLSPLPPKAWNVTVVAKGWMPVQRNVNVLPADMEPENFALEKGKTLRIRFVDRNGKPIPGVGVGIDGWHGNKALYNHKHPNVVDTKIPAQSNKEGIYEWTWAPDGEIRYQFYKEGVGEGSTVLTADGKEHTYVLPP